MQYRFTRIDLTGIDEEIALIEQEIRALQSKRDALAMLRDSQPQQKAIVSDTVTVPSGSFVGSPTLKAKVLSVLARGGEATIGEIAQQVNPAAFVVGEAKTAKAALYTVFNRNKNLFQNSNGRWSLTDLGKKEALMS